MDLNVVAKLRIMPTGVDVDLDAVTSGLKELVKCYGELHSSEVKPIAFGLSALEVNLLLSDDSGGLDEIVEKIKEIEGVAEVELQEAGRL